MAYQILAFGILLLTSAIGFTGFYLIERLVLKNGGRVDEEAIGKYFAVTNGINCIVAIPIAVPIFYGTSVSIMMLFDPSNTSTSFAMYAAVPFATIAASSILSCGIDALFGKLSISRTTISSMPLAASSSSSACV